MNKPSIEFIQALCDSGTLVVTCDLCGTIFFASDHEHDFEKGELENLRKKAELEPEKFVEWPNSDSVSYGTIDGKTVVPGHSNKCDDKIHAYEKWIVTHRYLIARYLKERSARLIENAKSEEDLTVVEGDWL